MPWVSRLELHQTAANYKFVRRSLSAELDARLPTFHNWLNDFVEDLKWYPSMDMVEVTETGARKLQMINSPHAATLLRAWVIRHTEAHDNATS